MVNKNFICFLGILQILLLITFIFSNSYILGQENVKVNLNTVLEKENKFLGKSLSLLVSFFSIKQIGTVSAQSNVRCCAETKNGAICQDLDQSNWDTCATNLEFTSCEETVSCKLGCCFDNQEGLCSTSSSQAECVANGGLWSDDPTCNTQECFTACCVLGDTAELTTGQRCSYLSSQMGIDTDYRSDIRDAYSCYQLGESYSDNLGACVTGTEIGQQTCSLRTESECLGQGQSFYEGILCSNQIIKDFDINCIRQTDTACFDVNGQEKLFWIDSCGNRENIYSSNRDLSWNSGTVLEDDEICTISNDLSNINSCGNCNRFQGTTCEEVKAGVDKQILDGGDQACVNLNCFYEGEQYQNGESWCVYDGAVGNGEDAMGSRHWKYACVQGEIKVEGCQDFRNGVCAQGESESIDGQGTLTSAQCVFNSWRDCLAGNSGGEGEEEGSCPVEGGFCQVTNVNVDEGFNFDVCTPLFPEGFDLRNQELKEDSEEQEQNTGALETAEDICSIATQTCKIYYVKKPLLSGGFGEWECVWNCNCENEAEFVGQMENLCRSLGDCGPTVNIIESEKVEGQFIDINQLGDYDPESLEGYSLKERKGRGSVDRTRNFLEYLFWNPGQTSSERTTIYGSLIILDSFLLGAATGVYLLVMAVDYFLFDGGKIKTEKVEYTCSPSSPPVGAEFCGLCNSELSDNGLKSCSEYRCHSLGTACQLFETDTSEPYCAPKAGGNDGNAPVITSQELENSCFSEGQNVLIKINTDEDSLCKFSFNENTPFDEMTQSFGNVYRQNHSVFVTVPRRSNVQEYLIENETEQFDSNFENILNGNLGIYVKCQDVWGNQNNDDLEINICIGEGRDVSQPEILSTVPNNGGYLSYGKMDSELTLLLNEPAQCKYSFENKLFNEMEYSMNCARDLGQGFSSPEETCSTYLQNATEKIYIKCMDQPLLEDVGLRNVMEQSYEYQLMKSESELSIKINSPKNDQEFSAGFSPISVNLEVQTQGGAGEAICEYKFNLETETKFVPFYYNQNRIHKQVFNSITNGDYNLQLRCEDIAGNSDEESISFSFSVDENSPKITRAFYGSGLTVITDEEAECYYTYDTCNFNFENATSMTTGFSVRHTAPWNREVTYHIKCADVWGNTNSGCAAKISPINY